MNMAIKNRFICKFFIGILTSLFFTSNFAANSSLPLQRQPGFFRFNFDDVKMPGHMQNMGLLGINYAADITPNIYAGIGAYGSVTGTQGGLFTLGLLGGFHKKLTEHWLADAGLYAGGGGGRSSLVGGGLMLRPYAGVAYDFHWAKLGMHYSYINFPSGEIHSQQIGVDLDIPYDFYYVPFQDTTGSLINISHIPLFKGKCLGYQRNDLAIVLQAYRQNPGTQNVNGSIQDGTIGLIGAEFDHYFLENIFWWIRTDGAFRGNPNGYMDILGGFGYYWPFSKQRVALLPQLGVGAGGGGNIDTGGGILIQPQLSIEFPLTSSLATRLGGGYLWAPKGQFKAATATAALVYHLDVATLSDTPPMNISNCYKIQNWRVRLFNQTYIHPQRTFSSSESAINLIAIQVDQFITSAFYFSYQAASAYNGFHAGGLASGMIGPGIQSPAFLYQRMKLFTELLVGVAGGASLALGGGSIIEPVVGMHYAMTPVYGLEASISQIKALHNSLNTPVFNLGFTISFGTLDH